MHFDAILYLPEIKSSPRWLILISLITLLNYLDDRKTIWSTKQKLKLKKNWRRGILFPSSVSREGAEHGRLADCVLLVLATHLCVLSCRLCCWGQILCKYVCLCLSALDGWIVFGLEILHGCCRTMTLVWSSLVSSQTAFRSVLLYKLAVTTSLFIQCLDWSVCHSDGSYLSGHK